MEFLRDSKGHFSTTKRVHSKAKNCANLKKIERVISSPRHPVYPDSNLSNFDSFTPAAGSTFCDHSYLHSSSFDDINNDFFGGRLKPLTFCRFVVDLQTFF